MRSFKDSRDSFRCISAGLISPLSRYFCVSRTTVASRSMYSRVRYSGLSGAIGLYQGCVRSRQRSANEFLVGDGRIGVMTISCLDHIYSSTFPQVIPTAMSLMASVMSAATLLGGPVEVYAYGTMYLYYRTYVSPSTSYCLHECDVDLLQFSDG